MADGSGPKEQTRPPWGNIRRVEGDKKSMPLYDYRCHKCGEVFEVMQKFSDEPLRQHEGCGGELERLLSPPALQFKGSGWYVTDYGRNGSANGKAAGNNGSAESSDTKSTNTSSESSGTKSSNSESSSSASSKPSTASSAA